MLSSSLFSAHASLSGLDRPPNRIGTDYRGQSGLQKKKSLVPACPPTRTCTSPESGKGQETSLQTHHTLDSTSSNSSPHVGTTEHWRPKLPVTRTTSFLWPSLWWTLNPSYSVRNNPCAIIQYLYILNYIYTYSIYLMYIKYPVTIFPIFIQASLHHRTISPFHRHCWCVLCSYIRTFAYIFIFILVHSSWMFA